MTFVSKLINEISDEVAAPALIRKVHRMLQREVWSTLHMLSRCQSYTEYTRAFGQKLVFVDEYERAKGYYDLILGLVSVDE